MGTIQGKMVPIFCIKLAGTHIGKAWTDEKA